MDRQEAQEFKERWRKVNEFMERRTRSASMTERWRQLAALLDPRFTQALEPAERDSQIVRERWARLRRAHI